MTELIVKNKEADQKLKKYLFRLFPNAPQSFTYKMLRKKNITLNGHKATGDEMLAEGDTVKIFISDETMMKFGSSPKTDFPDKLVITVDGEPFDIRNAVIYEDDDILCIDKPSGLLSQKAKDTDYSLNEMVVAYALNKCIATEDSLKEFTPSVVNRLDRNTSGLILAGLSLTGTRLLSKLIHDRLIDKYYLAAAEGRINDDIHDVSYLIKNEKTNKVTVYSEDEYNKNHGRNDNNAADRIVTEFHPLSYNDGITLLRVKLITGKSHQIRAVLAKLGHPIIGDTKYGSRKTASKAGKRGQMLQSYEMIFPSEMPDGLSPSETGTMTKYLGLHLISKI